MENKSDVIKLDVGGSLYTTSRSTLTRYPNSILGAMFSGPFSNACDEHGRYVVDSDGTIFRYVLNFLRRSKLNLPEDFKEWDLLTTEADFYQIKELRDAIASLRNRKAGRGCKIQKLEFIEIGKFKNNNYYYMGNYATLKEIPSFIEMIQKCRPESSLFGRRCGKIEVDYTSFEERRMLIFQEIALLGFELVATSRHWLFKGNFN